MGGLPIDIKNISSPDSKKAFFFSHLEFAVAFPRYSVFFSSLKDNSTMYKTEAQLVSYGILHLKPSSHQCQPSYKKYIAVQTPPNRHKI